MATSQLALPTAIYTTKHKEDTTAIQSRQSSNHQQHGTMATQ